MIIKSEYNENKNGNIIRIKSIYENKNGNIMGIKS